MIRTMPSTEPPGGSPCTMVIGRLGQAACAAAGIAPSAESPASTARRVSATMFLLPTLSQTRALLTGRAVRGQIPHDDLGGPNPRAMTQGHLNSTPWTPAGRRCSPCALDELDVRIDADEGRLAVHHELDRLLAALDRRFSSAMTSLAENRARPDRPRTGPRRSPDRAAPRFPRRCRRLPACARALRCARATCRRRSAPPRADNPQVPERDLLEQVGDELLVLRADLGAQQADEVLTSDRVGLVGILAHELRQRAIDRRFADRVLERIHRERALLVVDVPCPRRGRAAARRPARGRAPANTCRART